MEPATELKRFTLPRDPEPVPKLGVLALAKVTPALPENPGIVSAPGVLVWRTPALPDTPAAREMPEAAGAILKFARQLLFTAAGNVTLQVVEANVTV